MSDASLQEYNVLVTAMRKFFCCAGGTRRVILKMPQECCGALLE